MAGFFSLLLYNLYLFSISFGEFHFSRLFFLVEFPLIRDVKKLLLFEKWFCHSEYCCYVCTSVSRFHGWCSSFRVTCNGVILSFCHILLWKCCYAILSDFRWSEIFWFPTYTTESRISEQWWIKSKQNEKNV